MLRKHVGHPKMSCEKTLCALLIHILNWLCPKPKATNICQVYLLCTSMMESCDLTASSLSGSSYICQNIHKRKITHYMEANYPLMWSRGRIASVECFKSHFGQNTCTLSHIYHDYLPAIITHILYIYIIFWKNFFFKR